MRIVVFGDSIAQGFWDEEGGWVGRLRRKYDSLQIKDLTSNQPTVFNLGISGDMAQNVVTRLALETTHRKWPDEEFAIVIAIGINDALVFKGTEANTTELYNGELQQIVAAARQFAEKILFVGLTAVDETRSNPMFYGDYCYTNDRIWLFEQELRKFCQENNIACVEIFEAFKNGESLLADGLHPNAAGHELILSIVQPEIDKLTA